MKTIKLKKLGKFDYRVNLLGILKSAPAKGYSVDDVRLAVKALDVLETAKDKVEFEDNVYEFVKKSVNEAKFITASKELVGFIDDINANN